MAETASRLLELLSLLQARRDWTGPELAGRLEVCQRTVRRDVDRLRRLGYPVGSVTGPAGGYRLAAGAALPPLLLDEEEAVAIAVGLRTAARAAVTGIEETSLRALVKLEQVLPEHLRRRVRALGSAVTVSVGGGPTVDPQTLTVLASAHRDTERVRFSYRRRDGVAGRREVEPHALVVVGRRWYLVAWDLARDDWRTFRIDRISSPASTGRRFTPRQIPGDDPATFVSSGEFAGPNRYEARLTVHASAGEIRARIPGGQPRLIPIDANRCGYLTGDDDLGWLALRVVMLGVDVEVHEPPELRERLAQLADRLRRAAGADDGSGRVGSP